MSVKTGANTPPKGRSSVLVFDLHTLLIKQFKNKSKSVTLMFSHTVLLLITMYYTVKVWCKKKPKSIRGVVMTCVRKLGSNILHA